MLSIAGILAFAWRRKWDLGLAGLMFLVIGEIYTRLPFVPQRLEYQVDEELVGTLRPDQSGYLWLGRMSFASPPITLNADGHRGPETDWSAPVVLALGSSEGLGAGVEDRAVWTSCLEAGIRSRPGLERVCVVNACGPGQGPYHHARLLQRVLERHRPEVVVVRVGMGDADFGPPAPESLGDEVAAARVRQKVRGITRFLPYLVNKLQYQLPSIEASLRPHFLRDEEGGVHQRGLSAAGGERMWRRNERWWREIADAATAAGAQVVFVVHDATDTASGAALERHLLELRAGRAGVHVLRIDAGIFGIDTDQAMADRVAEYRRRFTLGRDPHANAEQHRKVGEEVLRFFDATDLTRVLRGG